MRYAPLFALLALGCSETPAPDADAQVDASRPDLCVCQDGTLPPDVIDAGGVDVVDAPAPVDAPDVPELPDVVDAAVGADAGDAVAVVDAVALDAGDAAVGDAPDVAVAVADAPDVQLADVVDAATDRPDVVDVPQDAGPVLYDLNAVRTGLEVRAVYRQPDRSFTEDCDGPVTNASCSVMGDSLRFAFRTCSTSFAGVFAVTSDAGTRALSLSTTGAGNFAPRLRFTAGTARPGSPSRQGFHIQFARDIVSPEPGATGIPGRTVDPMLGDIWILGCPLN